MKSMTGFGKANVAENGVSFSVEISSVNRKQMDLKIYLPTELRDFENALRQKVLEKMSRGAIMVRFSLEFDESLKKQSIRINHEILKNYYDEIIETAKNLGAETKISITDLLRLPEVIIPTNLDFEAFNLEKNALNVLDLALENFNQIREIEGENLALDLRERLNFLTNLAKKIELRSPEVAKDYQVKLHERIEKLLEKPLPIEEDSFAKELAIYADKCDITEEMVRLKSHFKLFLQYLESKKAVGRELDFLMQEIGREINTTGSKANDVEIAHAVVRFKTELEKIREQIQNIE